MTRSGTQHAWTVPSASVALAALICLAISSQFLFQGSVQDGWPWSVIGSVWLGNLWQTMLVASVILAALVLTGRLPLRHTSAKLAVFAATLLAGAYLGEWLSIALQWGAWPAAGPAAIVPRAFRWFPIVSVGAVILIGRQRTRDLSSRLHQTEISRLELDRQRGAMQLQLLQSQIEPHFLFNTLATIRHLQRTDPVLGHETLARYVRYLKASLPAMRSPETTLGQELDLVREYLEVMRVRMGNRICFRMDVAQDLRGFRIPPFSIATLVENAVKHGLAGLPAGGSVSVSAWRERERLKVRVSDTGKGLAATSGTGTGLANLRARLRGLYGRDGSLSLAASSPSGLVATLEIPLRRLVGDGGRDAA